MNAKDAFTSILFLMMTHSVNNEYVNFVENEKGDMIETRKKWDDLTERFYSDHNSTNALKYFKLSYDKYNEKFIH